MQTANDALQTLERLYETVERYMPLMYKSTPEGKELAQAIPVLYGEVEGYYRRIAGDQKVDVIDGMHRSTFNNFFEAGFLSGRGFHSTQGKTELMKVLGRARAEASTAHVSSEPATEAVWSLLHTKVQVEARSRFDNTEYADAVFAAMRALNNEVKGIVKSRAGRDLDGVDLMHTAFSPKNPIIVLADLSSDTGRDMQQGYMEMFAGAMSAVRNPKAHESVVLTPERAIHLLFVASTLWHTLDARI
jgi:uncharacterized protein (TIGR02391 family)